jgi:hypothetical protein
MKAQNGSRSVAVLINLGARWGWFVNATPWPLYSQERSLVQVLEKAGWAPWPVWTVMKSRKARVSTSVRTPDRPASSETPYVRATLQYSSDRNTLHPVGKSHKVVTYKSEKFLLLTLTESQSCP